MKSKNVLNFANLIESDLSDFFSVSIAIIKKIKNETEPLPYLMPEYIEVEKDLNNVIINLNLAVSVDEFYKYMYMSAEYQKN